MKGKIVLINCQTNFKKTEKIRRITSNWVKELILARIEIAATTPTLISRVYPQYFRDIKMEKNIK